MNFIREFSYFFSSIRCCWCVYIYLHFLCRKKESFKFIVCAGIVGRFFILLSQRRNGISSVKRQQKRDWRCRFHYNAINLFPPTIVSQFSPSHKCTKTVRHCMCVFACRGICCCVCNNDTVARDIKNLCYGQNCRKKYEIYEKSHTLQKEKKKQMMQWHGDERWWLAWKIVCMRWKKR